MELSKSGVVKDTVYAATLVEVTAQVEKWVTGAEWVLKYRTPSQHKMLTDGVQHLYTFFNRGVHRIEVDVTPERRAAWDKSQAALVERQDTTEVFIPIDTVGGIIAYEEGRLSDQEIARLFQHLIDTGVAWRLPSRYRRIILELVKNGACHLSVGG
jgi:hypothetical protein